MCVVLGGNNKKKDVGLYWGEFFLVEQRETAGREGRTRNEGEADAVVQLKGRKKIIPPSTTHWIDARFLFFFFLQSGKEGRGRGKGKERGRNGCVMCAVRVLHVCDVLCGTNGCIHWALAYCKRKGEARQSKARQSKARQGGSLKRVSQRGRHAFLILYYVMCCVFGLCDGCVGCVWDGCDV